MDAIFLRDGNLPDETHMQPGTKFTKSWVMSNNGTVCWDDDTKVSCDWSIDTKLLLDGDSTFFCLRYISFTII